MHFTSTRTSLSRDSGSRLMALIASFTLFALLVGVAPRPARADSASTTAVLIGAAAAAAAIIISNNVRHKQAQANTPVGRTQDGGIVYADGRIVYRNGDVLYTGTQSGQRCAYTDNYGVPCGSRPVAYYPRGYNGHDHGHHYGWYKHHGRDNDDGTWRDDRGRGHGHGYGHRDRDDRGDRDD